LSSSRLNGAQHLRSLLLEVRLVLVRAQCDRPKEN
jgi:hypothetical protein